MTVQAGAALEAVQAAAEAAGLFCPLDLGARGSCAIGGNLSTNAGGNRVVRYGMTREMVLGLEVVLPDGTVLDAMNRLIKNNAGYDLKQLFIGAEGTLGIVTRAVLRLQPRPRFIGAAFCGLADFAAVQRLFQEARAVLPGSLSAFEVMWPAFYELMTTRASGVRTPLAGRHGRYVLLEAHGGDEAFDGPRLETFLGRMLEEGTLEDAAVARSSADTRAFWALRDAVVELEHILGPTTGFDVSLPMAEMDGFVAEAEAAIAAAFPGARSVSFGHVGDGNLHLVTTVPGQAPQPKVPIMDLVYGIVRRRGGAVSAEHGIGTLKRPWLSWSRTAEELALMRLLKRAIDPANIMNPGKILEA
jgi:FAD/FMN-containing dehydrogenase